jgi:glycosyltransferase involved in cell wall biosynthesis
MRSHLSLLTRGLVERGVGVTVAAPADFQLVDADPHAARIHQVAVPIRARPHPVLDLVAAARVAIRARQADLVHAHGLRVAWITALARRRGGPPVLVTAHNLAPQAPGAVASALLRFTLSRVRRTICVSQAVADSLARFGIVRERTVVIPNGIDLTRFDQPVDAAAVRKRLGVAGPQLVVAVGRLSPEKGFTILVAAAAQVAERRQDVVFVLAGEGPTRDALGSEIARCGLQGRFGLAGLVDCVPELVASADLVVVPSLAEGQGIVAVEAMAARRPVVASRVGGLPETVVDGVTGVLVPPGDSAALASAILRLLDAPAERARMGAAGRARAEAEYSGDVMVERTLGVYRDVGNRP